MDAENVSGGNCGGKAKVGFLIGDRLVFGLLFFVLEDFSPYSKSVYKVQRCA